MKTLLVLFLMVSLFASPVFSDDSHQADREQLRALLTKVADALNSQNMEELSANLAKDFVFTTLDQKVIRTPQELNQYYESLFKTNNAIIKSYKTTPTIDDNAIFLSETICFCVGSAVDEYNISNIYDMKLPIRWSTVLEKEDGVWKVKMLHFGANFYDNPVIDQITSGTKISLYAAIAIAFVAGFLLHLIISKRQKK